MGDTITVLNRVLICEKYIPKTNKESVYKSKRKKVKKILFPDFKEHEDTKQLDYNLGDFKAGDLCYITSKMHGTSGRTAYLKKAPQNIIQKIIYKFKPKWSVVSGTRRTVLNDYSGGFYGDNAFRKKYNDLLATRLKENETVYYEIVGYTDCGTIMASCNNRKVNDKEFVKKYGETTDFTYGCNPGENQMYVYRMTYTNKDGDVIEYPWDYVKYRCEQMGLLYCPEFDKFLYTTEEDLLERVNKYIDGADVIGKTHIREGVVVRIEKPSFTAYKKKNLNFKILEGIIKEAATEPDMEERE